MHTVCTSIKSKNKVVVIGGGAAGMMAALQAAKNGAAVTLLEKNEKFGKKVYITGKGRCNLTNDCTLEEFMQSVPKNPRFLYAAMHSMMPQDVMNEMEEMNCPVKVERGQRVFPVSEKASDVTRAFERGMQKYGVKSCVYAEVKKICTAENKVTGVQLSDGTVIEADAVIVATGGLSYPSTGSTGDGYAFAKDTGHQVTPQFPSLTGFDIKEDWPKELQGLSLKNISLSASLKGKNIFCRTGEMLFTHYGISGPLVIELSSLVCDKNLSDVEITLDLKPGMTEDQLDARLKRDLAAAGKKQIATILPQYLPQHFAAMLPALAGFDGHKNVSQISAAERKNLLNTLKKLKMHPVSSRDYSEAIVTRGGVSVKDVNSSTMESKHVHGLYFAGEVLDVDAFTGGFNLQIAFSTGALAGKSAANAEI